MNAKDFLNTLKLPKRSRGEDESDITWLYYEKGVIEAMEQYHQRKVNNVVLDAVIPRYVHRKIQKNDNYSVMEIGENDNPRLHPKEWCDRRVCEGFWGNEELAKKFVNKMNEV